MLDQDDPNNIDNLDTETQDLARRVLAMRTTNNKMKNEIERLGGGIDTSEARLDFTLAALCRIGLITSQQVWEINYAWEDTARPQIRAMRNKMVELSQDKARQEQAANLNVKESPGIILPRGMKR